MHPYIDLSIGVGSAAICPFLAFLASLFSTFPSMQNCYLEAPSFQHAHDGLVSHLGRGLELGLSFSTSVGALELYSQFLAIVFLPVLLILSQLLPLFPCLCS